MRDQTLLLRVTRAAWVFYEDAIYAVDRMNDFIWNLDEDTQFVIGYNIYFFSFWSLVFWLILR